MVEFGIVNDEKAIMGIGKDFYINLRVLAVISLYIQAYLILVFNFLLRNDRIAHYFFGSLDFSNSKELSAFSFNII
jgi:hypothetical protein